MTSRDLPELPDNDAFVEAVRAICEEKRAAQTEHGYFRPRTATANEVAIRLGIQPARRLGRGAVGGSWSGFMSPALRVAPRLVKLAREGRLARRMDDDPRGRYAYMIP